MQKDLWKQNDEFYYIIYLIYNNNNNNKKHVCCLEEWAKSWLLGAAEVEWFWQVSVLKMS